LKGYINKNKNRKMMGANGKNTAKPILFWIVNLRLAPKQRI
jgi:hypothetical protein